MKTIKALGNWLDNSWVGNVLFLLLLVLCFLLFWVGTPSGMQPTQEQIEVEQLAQ